jgi:AcrR family transcriptional regulator
MSPRTKTQIAHLRNKRKAQILQAASIVFSRKGFHAANVSDVAAEAGVSQGTVYHYFDSKDDLFMAVFETWETGYLNREVLNAMNISTSASERLHYLVRAVEMYMDQAEEFFPASLEFWSHIHRDAAIREGVRHIFAELRAIVAQLIQDGIDQGEFVSIDSETTASLLIAAYDGLILQWMADPSSVNWQTVSETLIELVFHGLSKTTKKP